MAERRLVGGRPVNQLARQLEDGGDMKWVEKNIHIKDEFIERVPPRTGNAEELEIARAAPTPGTNPFFNITNARSPSGEDLGLREL